LFLRAFRDLLVIKVSCVSDELIHAMAPVQVTGGEKGEKSLDFSKRELKMKLHIFTQKTEKQDFTLTLMTPYTLETKQ